MRPDAHAEGPQWLVQVFALGSKFQHFLFFLALQTYNFAQSHLQKTWGSFRKTYGRTVSYSELLKLYEAQAPADIFPDTLPSPRLLLLRCAVFALLSRTRQTTTENFVAQRLSGQVDICADLSIFIKKMLEKPCMNLVISLHLRVLMVKQTHCCSHKNDDFGI